MNLNKRYRVYELVTGCSIILITIIASILMALVFSPVFEMNKLEFSNHILKFKTPFIFGIIGWFIIFICDLVITLGLYKIYLKKNKFKAGVMALFRLIYSLILMVAIIQLLNIFKVFNASDKVYELIIKFQSIWQFGLIFFGIHLLLLSRLVCEKKIINRILSALLFIAGIGYLGSNIADLLIADYETIRFKVEVIFILPMVLGEFGLAIWLIFKRR